jgi:hypothetical protein
MRTLVLLLAAGVLLAADVITPETLHGAWELDDKAVTKEQKADAAAAKAVDGFGITFTLRTARVIFGEDNYVAGMWRVDGATATTATVVIQPKGGEERSFHITLDGKTKMTVAEAPGKLPLIKTR